MRYVVLGGAGAMGRITVRDLVETSDPDDRIVIADYDLGKARALAASLRDPRVSAVRVDVKDRPAAMKALRGAFVLINGVQYHLNLDVMELALALKCHYVDLGGLFHMTRRQLPLHGRFKAVGRTALIGMGAAPGITNVLARWAADRLDTVAEIHARIGTIDRTRYTHLPALPVAYSLKTILEEFSMRPAVFTRGRLSYVEPMSGDAPHRFAPPVGVCRPMYTIHSEVATLPSSFRDKGVREVSFKIAFDPSFVDRVRFLRDLGLASHEAVLVPAPGGRGVVSVAPVDLANKVAMSQPPSRQVGPLRQHEVVRAVVKGTRGGRRVTWVADCHAVGMPSWGVGVDIDTGSPPAVAAQMLAAGEIVARGVLPPEKAVPPDSFFRRLKRRRMTLRAVKKSGWSFPV
ncbi:MAG: saccharopine dehydrogenase family protein [Elusimicrobiota bacterium]